MHFLTSLTNRMLSNIYMKNVNMQTPLFYFYWDILNRTFTLVPMGKGPSSNSKFLPKNTYGQQGFH